VKARQFAFNIEISNLAEVEEPLVKPRPLVQPTAMDVMRQMVDILQTHTVRFWVFFAEPFEIDVIN
jgi:hypothetical protein